MQFCWNWFCRCRHCIYPHIYLMFVLQYLLVKRHFMFKVTCVSLVILILMMSHLMMQQSKILIVSKNGFSTFVGSVDIDGSGYLISTMMLILLEHLQVVVLPHLPHLVVLQPLVEIFMLVVIYLFLMM